MYMFVVIVFSLLFLIFFLIVFIHSYLLEYSVVWFILVESKFY